jgi:hypothetical protein
MSEREILQEKINRLEVLLGHLENFEAEYGASDEVIALRERILGYLARRRDELREAPDPN